MRGSQFLNCLRCDDEYKRCRSPDNKHCKHCYTYINSVYFKTKFGT